MFKPTDSPRLFGLAPGVDFPDALVAGLRDRLGDAPPHAMAQVDLIVNTRRMARRLRAIFDAGPPAFLPRIHLLSDLTALAPHIHMPRPVPPLRRRLELVALVSRLLDANTGIAPRSSLYALSDSLADLIDEMQGEGVSAETVSNLDVSSDSAHWKHTQQFLKIADTYLQSTDRRPDAEAFQRQFVTQLIASWDETPPQHPVIVAGSTGSRGTTALLLQAVARLPQGALVLPGYDFDMPPELWHKVDADAPPEDHPQFRFFDLARRLKHDTARVIPWIDTPPPSPERNALVSLSLRPAPVTDTWLEVGPKLQQIGPATENVTLIEAANPRNEALTIAMRLRKAADAGQKAALITPDRMLTRQVTAALDRWNILPDDSAGTPLHLSPPGRLLRQAAGLFVQRLDAKALLALLKHPLTHSGPNRDTHQIGTLKLEALIRRKGLPYPDTSNLVELGKDLDQGWLAWVAKTFCGQHRQGAQPLSDWVAQHSVLAEKIAAGVEAAETHGLWKKAAGQKAESVLQALTQEADNGGMMSASDYAEMFYALLSAEEVRDRDAPHPGVMIWGTLEARVQGADLVILGGLNEGSWPEAPAQDPWLNRQMRLKAGLLLPERRIGLSAHDYQQAIAAPEVWLTRAIRSDEAETIPSRWLSRLTNLMGGLPDGQGQRALEGMRRRGAAWLGQAKALELASNRPPAPRPSPCPPVISRPNTLSVTEIKRLIRDPYAVYARHVLRVRPLNPLVQSPDAPVRGIIMHQVMEDFVRRLHKEPSALSKEALMCIANTVLATAAPWPAARAMWRARIERIAAWFIAGEQIRQAHASASVFEDDAKGKITLDDIGFTLVGKADRIDTTVDGRAIIYDYKTGNPPSEKEQKFFDKQLLLEAAMLEQGGFEALGPLSVAEAKFIGLGAQPKEVRAPLEVENTKVILADLRELIASYRAVDQGYTSRRIVQKEDDAEDYDHLARFGEWDGTSPTVRQHLK